MLFQIEHYLQAKVAKNDFSNENLYLRSEPLEGYPTDQMVTSYQPTPSWVNEATVENKARVARLKCSMIMADVF